MSLELKDKGTVVAKLDKDDALLSSYNPKNGMEIYIQDNDPNNTIAALSDISNAEKYVMPDEIYQQRENSVLKMKEKALEVKYKVGDSCEVIDDNPSLPSRKGQIAYLGTIEGAKGLWVGVILDEPQGKNDGSAKGKRYFTCQPNHGAFVRPEKITMKETKEKENPSQKETPQTKHHDEV